MATYSRIYAIFSKSVCMPGHFNQLCVVICGAYHKVLTSVVERLVHSTRGYDSPALSVRLTAGAASEHAGDARCAANGVQTSR